MTKIIQKSNKQDVQTHIDKAYEIIKDSLPVGYVEKVMSKLKDDETLNPGTVRNIKNRISKYPFSRLDVLNALVEVAIEYQSSVQKLAKNLNTDN